MSGVRVTRCRDAKVIEIYERHAAVKFMWHGKERVECVERRGTAANPTLGQIGWAIYTVSPSGGLWSFMPYNRIRRVRR